MEYYNGVVKVKDGLFMGNFETGEDLDFITDNKITRIINCAGFELANLYDSAGVKYLKYHWLDNSVQILFDEEDEVIREVSSFIDQSLEKGESCLIWSVNGCSRSACIISAYLMYKYSWSLYKTLDYLNSKFQSLSLSPNFLHQLFKLQERLLNNHQKPLTNTWEYETQEIENLVLQNTYLNSKPPKLSLHPKATKALNSLTWAENLTKDKENKQSEGPIVVKSCLKGGDSSFVYTPSRSSSTDKEVSFRSDNKDVRKAVSKQTGKGTNGFRTVRTPSPMVFTDITITQNRLRRPWR